MKINDNLETQTSRPVDGSVNVNRGTRNVWRVEGVVRPVADWDTNDIETSLRDLVEVFPSHERIPVLSENLKSGIFPEFLTQGVLVDDIFSWTTLICCIEQ